MPAMAVHGADLCYEVRGTGAPVLFIPGAAGDGGYFDRVTGLLADEFITVTYDLTAFAAALHLFLRRVSGRLSTEENAEQTRPLEPAR